MEYSSLFVTLMGIGTVFFGLICIIFLTMAMGAILKGKEKAPAAPAPPSSLKSRRRYSSRPEKSAPAATSATVSTRLDKNREPRNSTSARMQYKMG